MFGGQGSAVLDIAHQLRDLPLILLCGHNAAGRQAARCCQRRRAIIAQFCRVRHWMQLADWFVDKPFSRLRRISWTLRGREDVEKRRDVRAEGRLSPFSS
jgi:hypothetical protein